jgi:hypothetical protein
MKKTYKHTPLYTLNQLKKLFSIDKSLSKPRVKTKAYKTGGINISPRTIYEYGYAINKTGKIEINGIEYDVRAVVKCLMYGHDYFPLRSSNIEPEIENMKRDQHGRILFMPDEISCKFRNDGIEWADADQVAQLDLDLSDDAPTTEPPVKILATVEIDDGTPSVNNTFQKYMIQEFSSILSKVKTKTQQITVMDYMTSMEKVISSED